MFKPFAVLVLAATCALPSSLHAFEPEKLSFSVGVSTAGVKGEVAYRFTEKFALRGFVGGALTAFADGSVNGIDYDFSARLGGGGILADYYPTGKRFRLSAGIFKASNRAKARANGTLDVGGTIFPEVGLEGNVTPIKDITPFFSIGYDQPLGKNVFLAADIGAIVTEGFRIDLRQTSGPAIPPELVDLEEIEFRDKALPVLPFISLSIAYRF